MSWFDVPTVPRTRAEDDGWYSWSGKTGLNHALEMLAKSKSGQKVTPDSAMALSAYWAGCRLITEALMLIPLQVRRRTVRSSGQEQWSVDFDNPVHQMFQKRVNPRMGAKQFRQFMCLSAINWGTGFAEKQFDTSGKLVHLWPIHPSRVKEIHMVEEGNKWGFPAGDLVFRIAHDKGEDSWLHERNMYWIPGPLSEDGILGKSTVKWMANSLGNYQAQESHVAAFYRQGASPDFAIKVTGNPTKEKRIEMRESFQETYGGADNAHKMMFLWGGMELAQVGLSPADSQLLESRQFSVGDIARALKVPPHMISLVTEYKLGSLEEQSIDFLMYSMAPWCAREEEAAELHLLSNEPDIKVHHKISELHRFDLKSHTEHVEKMSQFAIYSVNEGRESFGLEPIDGGDVRFVANNNLVPLEVASDPEYYQKQNPSPPASPAGNTNEEEDDEEQSTDESD